MSSLVINDIPKLEELDRAAFATLLGGIHNGWILVPVKRTQSPQAIINNFYQNNTVIQQNPTYINVDTGDGNSGSYVYNITAVPVLASSSLSSLAL